MKHHKLDPYLVSLQRWEINYLMRKFHFWDRRDLTFKEVKEVIKQAKKECGNSRKKIYKYLRQRFVEYETASRKNIQK